MFWKQVKPFFSDKTPSNDKITLSGNEIISSPSNCAEILNNFFCDADRDLDIDRSMHINRIVNADDPVQKYIEMYKNHPSILEIQEEGILRESFSFLPVSETLIHSVISNIDSSKAYQSNNIPSKVLKDNTDIFITVLSSDINNCIFNGIFSSNLKYADITPIFKKLERLLKINYRPVSILPTLSKIYEKVIYQQMYEYFDKLFSKHICGFRKRQSTQHCLLFMLESLKKALDKGLSTGILLTDLSKGFDCIFHDLLIAKLHAYRFSRKPLHLVHDYLSERKQRTKIGTTNSPWREIIYGVPQGSIFGPLLFNTYINNIFLFSKHFNMANYADDCSPYEFSGSIEDIIQKLQNDSQCLMGWYESNYST